MEDSVHQLCPAPVCRALRYTTLLCAAGTKTASPAPAAQRTQLRRQQHRSFPAAHLRYYTRNWLIQSTGALSEHHFPPIALWFPAIFSAQPPSAAETNWMGNHCAVTRTPPKRDMIFGHWPSDQHDDNVVAISLQKPHLRSAAVHFQQLAMVPRSNAAPSTTNCLLAA